MDGGSFGYFKPNQAVFCISSKPRTLKILRRPWQSTPIKHIRCAEPFVVCQKIGLVGKVGPGSSLLQVLCAPLWPDTRRLLPRSHTAVLGRHTVCMDRAPREHSCVAPTAGPASLSSAVSMDKKVQICLSVCISRHWLFFLCKYSWILLKCCSGKNQITKLLRKYRIIKKCFLYKHF